MKKILVVDDNRDLKNLYERLLSIAGHVVETAENGIDALKTLENFNFCFDVILTDINMPKMDGFKLAQEIQKKNKKIKIIFMTGLPEKHEKIRKAKFPRCKMLGKPFYAKELINLL